MIKRPLKYLSPKILNKLMIASVLLLFLISIVPANGPSSITLNSEYSTLEATPRLVSADLVKRTVMRMEPQSINDVTLTNGESIYLVKAYHQLSATNGEVSVSIATEVDAYTGEILTSDRTIQINGETITESSKELVVVQNNDIRTITNVAVSNKQLLRDKACRLSMIPMVSIEKIRKPSLTNVQPFAVQVKKNHGLSYLKKLLPSDALSEYDFILVKSRDLTRLLEHPSIVKISDADNLDQFIEHMKELLKEEAKAKIKKLNLKKTTVDVDPDVAVYLNEDHWEVQPGQISAYQQFVTPNDETILELASTVNTPEEAYEVAVDWIWVSDNTLHGKVEKWLKPDEFLTDTSSYVRNPVQGSVVSDCSEQANTLVSLLRAIGVPAEEVRVAIGKVNFDGVIGGHAWVEIWKGNGWMPIDVTSGNYYDDENGRLVIRNAIPYEYWMYHPYPVVEVWAYYNDMYYSDSGEEIALGWSQNYDYEAFIDAATYAGFISLESLNLTFIYILIGAIAIVLIITLAKIKNKESNR